MPDVTGFIQGAWDKIVDIAYMFVKIPLMIWFDYVPAPIRWGVEILVLLLSIYMIYWMYKHRYDWMKVHTY